jgi:ArsR family transcriptional regulator
MNRTVPAAIYDHLNALADATRNRLLLLLERHELTVTELCTTLQLPQSTVSRHLKALADSGWVASRAEGTSHLYTMSRVSAPPARAGRPGGSNGSQRLDEAAARLWALVRDEVRSSAEAARDERRLERVLATRRTRSQAFFASSAGRWDRLRHELFGEAFHVAALTAFLDPDWVVGDLGCGTGQMTAALAPFVKALIAVDGSAAMLQAASRRLAAAGHVDLRRGELEALPIDDGRLNAATLVLVLHHLPEPARALGEVARVLAPGGRVVVVDMLPHERESYRQQMGHVWLGFSAEHIRSLLTDAGLEPTRLVPLDPDPHAKGPGLFVATARKP